MKQICVIGLGSFGSHLAVTLARQGCEVLAIDNREEHVARIRDRVHHALILDARDFSALKLAIPPTIDGVVVSLGGDLAASILCALHLKNLGVKSIRSKAANDEHAQILKAIGVETVFFPERETAERMAMRIMRPNLLEFFPLGEEYEVLEVGAPPSFLGKSLADMQIRNRYRALVIAIRNPRRQQMTFMPPADYLFLEGDELIVMGKEPDLRSLSRQS